MLTCWQVKQRSVRRQVSLSCPGFFSAAKVLELHATQRQKDVLSSKSVQLAQRDRTYGSWICQAKLTKRIKVNACFSTLTLSTGEISLVTPQEIAHCTKWTEQTGINNISPPSPAASIRSAYLKSPPAASAQSNVISPSSLSVFLSLRFSPGCLAHLCPVVWGER